ncbi:CPBP family intramembrane glutamic endopeptidase [Ferdinandcohnia quinoae]|uniref:CPBP family intramembrane metalloprotease n=1 Tax=Fredinandcohnia quinoae TaxID=2918902 RepID=A0AAW5DZF0_9BACI|nr:type II CAAX endopeptidase family protein [Fredinandcohnia sp. SECRCQ15]MCH1626027.1 CPBP family intramembrane metalloprotease [Fredinandcohnia sp. SECRCQ15]
MKKRSSLKKPLQTFVILSYAIFFVFFMGIGISMLLGAPESISSILQIISAWSSTFAFIILFRRIYPGVRLKDFIQEKFTPRIKVSVLSSFVLIQVIIVSVTILLLSNKNDTQNLSLSIIGLAFIFSEFFDNLIRGPLGEELGWRGYALNELQKKYSALRSALIVGVLWGFWHTPIWFTSGYTGVDLVNYIVLFMIGILSFSIIVTLFYNLNKNLVIPIMMHQLFNFFIGVIKGDRLEVLTYVMLSYFVVAVIVVIVNPKGILYKKRGELYHK